MNWDGFTLFLAVSRAGSLSDAAEICHSSISTVGRRIEQLEAALKCRLFTRHAQGYRLTEAGIALIGRVESIETSVEALRNDPALMGTVSGLVRLATTEVLAEHFIIPRLADLRQAYPALSLALRTGPEAINMSRNEVDMALRLVRPQKGSFQIRKLATIDFAVYGSQQYLMQRPWLGFEMAASHAWIGWPADLKTISVAEWLYRISGARMPVLTTSSLHLQQEAAAAGLGLTLLPTFIAKHNPRFLAVTPPQPELKSSLWLVIQQHLAGNPTMRAVSSFIVRSIKAAL